ncbi:unnamed protein product [Diamesa serratosioi]
MMRKKQLNSTHDNSFLSVLSLKSSFVFISLSHSTRHSTDSIPYSSIPKTKFTCQNRGSGYYADVETGCQVYHMCDQQGKQFDYVCPNATLFQQRMLVCDHWYMVNCSQAESNYKYNSLIGQRNTPFVSESEHEQRTPRPDLIDRPYAPDYDGASFKKQLEKNNERRNAFSEESLESVGRNMRPPPTVFEPPRLLPNSNQQFRQQEEARLRQLGLPQTPSKQFVAQPARATPVATNFQPGKQSVVRTFDPDKNFKAFENYFNNGKKATHKDYDFSRYFTKKEGGVTTPAPSRFIPAPQTTKRAFVPFSTTTTTTTTTTTRRPTTTTTTTTTRRPTTTTPTTTRRTTTTTARTTPRTTTTRATTARTTTTRVQKQTTSSRIQSNYNQKQQNNYQPNQFQRAPVTQTPRAQNGFNQKKIAALPSRDILPPREGDVKSYDDSTTQGPPIYYEWKIPASALLPPLFGNETNEPTVSKQIKRTINGEGNFDGTNDFTSSESRRIKAGTKIQDKDLQRIFSIPQFDFPIENTGRDGYENLEALNSFQVKIPVRRDGGQQQSGAQQRYYYLENEHCDPSCHPSFFKPGRCEPCVKL